MEVGKKYKHGQGSTVYTAIWADDKGALIEWSDTGGLGTLRSWASKNLQQHYEEFKEPRTLKGWVRVYKDHGVGSGPNIPTFGGIVWKCEKEARNGGGNFELLEINWTEKV